MTRPTLLIAAGAIVSLAAAGAWGLGAAQTQGALVALALAAGAGLGLLVSGLASLRGAHGGAARAPELQSGEALFRDIEVSPFPAAVASLESGRILAINERLASRIELTVEEAVGLNARDFYAVPEDRDRLVEAVRASGRTGDRLVRLRTARATPFWVTISARRVTWADEPAILSVFHDVDSRILAEQALKESEQRLAAQIEALTELTSTGASGAPGLARRLQRILESCARTVGVERASVWRFDESRSVIRCADLFETSAGRHSEGVAIPRAGHAAYFEAIEHERLIAADDAHRDRRTCEFSRDYLRPLSIGAMLDVPLRQDDLAVGVLCLEHVGGKRAWTVDEQNFALSVANLIAAVTAHEERSEALQRLAESEERARLVVDTAPDAFIGMDSDGRVVSWNTQAEQVFGWSAREVIGVPVAETIIPGSFREPHLEGLKRFHETGEAPVVNQRLELTALHRDGHEFPVELSVSEPIRWRDGYFFGAFLRDISERRRREAELHEAKESAEAAARAKSEFLANMSHELRTPLNGVLGYAQILRRDRALPASHREAVDGITRSGSHLLDLINEVLDFSKIEAGRVEVEPARTELRQLARDLRLLMAEPARRKDLTLEVRLDPDLPRRVVLDGRHLRQVLLNLLGNSIKFTHDGGVRLSIAREGDQRLRFDIVDTGIGIEPEDVQAIFEAFRQTHAGARAGGTGLGLTISQRLVRAMGGELRVESEPGRGSRFWFAVPFAADTMEADEGPGADADAGLDLHLAPGQDVIALVVDDSTVNRRIMAGLLESAGVRTLTAAGGAEGVRMAREQRPDVIIMDLKMSDVDGFEATRRLRSDPATSEIPVLAVTASPSDDVHAAALRAGCRDFLAKPLRAADFFGALARHLGVRFEPAGTGEADPALAPGPVPESVAERLRRAAAIGSLSDLHAIARELSEGDERDARLGRRIERLASDFEFEAIERLASVPEERDERAE